MSVIQIKTPEISSNIKTFLSQDYTSGTTLYVDDGSGFTNGNYVVVGEPGLEKTEITSLTAAPGSSSMTIGALNFPHSKGTPVYFTRWDKYSLQYQTSSTGAWTTYASMPASLRWDAQNTEYRDASATTTYQWRYRYYSTEETAYSDYSDTISASGWSEATVGYMVRNIRKIINDPEAKTISDAEVIRFINAAQDKIYTLYKHWWFLFKEGTVIDTVASTDKYSLPTDFGRMHTLLFNYVSGATNTTYPLKYISITEMDYLTRDNTANDDDNVKYFTILPGDSTNPTGYIRLEPTPATAGLDMTPRYYKTFTKLDSYADATECPLPAMLEDYALSQIFFIRKEEEKGKFYDVRFREQVDLLKLMQGKEVGQPRSLWQFKGRKFMDRWYGDGYTSLDSDRENNW